MREPFRLLCLAAAFLLFFRTAAGEVEALARELDDIERNFWTAAALPHDSLVRQEVTSRLASFYARVSTLQKKVREQGIKGPNLTVSCAQLQEIFGMLKPSSLPGHRIALKETGMSAYQREFQRSQRFKQKSARDLPKYPTLKIVNAVSYASWVDAVFQSNLQKLRNLAKSGRAGKKSKSGRAPVSTEVRNTFETYILAIARLRAGFVSLAQNKLYQENPKPQEPPHVRKNH